MIHPQIAHKFDRTHIVNEKGKSRLKSPGWIWLVGFTQLKTNCDWLLYMSINLNRRGLATVTWTDDWKSNAWLLAMQSSTYTRCAPHPYPRNALIIQPSIIFLIKKKVSPILCKYERKKMFDESEGGSHSVESHYLWFQWSGAEEQTCPPWFLRLLRPRHDAVSYFWICQYQRVPKGPQGAPNRHTRRLNITHGSAWLAICLSDTYLRSSATCQQGGAPIERERL